MQRKPARGCRLKSGVPLLPLLPSRSAALPPTQPACQPRHPTRSDTGRRRPDQRQPRSVMANAIRALRWMRCNTPTRDIPVRRWHGRDCRGAVGAASAPQPCRSALAGRDRSCCPTTRVDAAVRTAAPHGLRPADERTAQLSPVAQQTPAIPRSVPRRVSKPPPPARPGLGQRRRHGTGRETAGTRVHRPGHAVVDHAPMCSSATAA